MTTKTAPVSKLLAASRRLTRALKPLRFAEPVTHVYNPLEYASACNEQYLDRYARRGIEALFLGMNPGPFGMVQTGIPFGEVDHVRDWLGIDAEIRAPRSQHPKRPIEGFVCERSEVSGRRLWGWAAKRFGRPERFFERFFVWNYCPLAFLEESGRNRTPDKLAVAEREALYAVCDAALRDFVKELQPAMVIGVGKFAEGRARAALGDGDASPKIATVLHPSPASPIANRGWEPQAEKQLRTMGLTIST